MTLYFDNMINVSAIFVPSTEETKTEDMKKSERETKKILKVANTLLRA